MQNEMALPKNDFKRDKDCDNNNFKLLFSVANDSLFYFGIFLAAAFVLNYLAVIIGISENSYIGINEVLVSGLGFFNIFFAKSFFRFLKKVT
jgi:hypothetical protein